MQPAKARYRNIITKDARGDGNPPIDERAYMMKVVWKNGE
jgi:hypothetical protein